MVSFEDCPNPHSSIDFGFASSKILYNTYNTMYEIAQRPGETLLQ
jgi:hypothetical protein